MSRIIVLDASAAVRLVVGPTPAAIVATLRQADSIIAPDLIGAEVANALWKYVQAGHLTTSDATTRLQAALDICDDLIAASPSKTSGSVLTEALAEACRLNHPVYDLLYLVTARRHAASLATCDHRLANLAASQGITIIQG